MFGFECFSQHGVPRVHERCISLIQFVQHHSHPELRLSDSESVSLGESTWERAILPFPSISTDSLILHQDFATFQKFQIVRIAMTILSFLFLWTQGKTRSNRMRSPSMLPSAHVRRERCCWLRPGEYNSTYSTQFISNDFDDYKTE